MRIGVPAETAAGETRVAVMPETAKKLVAQGHEIRIQSGAGVAASVTDEVYAAAGARVTDAAGVFGCEVVLKVRIGALPDAWLTAHGAQAGIQRPRAVHRAELPSPRQRTLASSGLGPSPLPVHPRGRRVVWRLASEFGGRQETVKVRGALSSNDGECALAWALDGHGILLRSQWDTAPHLRTGRLRHVLPQWQPPPADIYVVFSTKAHMSAKTRALVDFLHARVESSRNDKLAEAARW